MTQTRNIQHLYWRAGFGIGFESLESFREKSPRELARQLLKDAQDYRSLKVTSTDLPDLKGLKELSKEARQELMKENREALRDLNFAWLKRMSRLEGALREKMTLFWHDHFACRLGGVYQAQRQNNTFRKFALGTFEDLLFAVAKDPGMLQFLNNQQNRKAHPNENFARELLELFTLGRGHYSEQDIREAARAFTGWGFNQEGEFVFRKKQHDYGTKTFLGRSGNFDGDDILRIVLEEKQTARHLVKKLYRFFVSPEEDETVIERWAEDFYQQGYDISHLLEKIFTSDHFYSEAVIGSRIKSPIEYLVGLKQQLNLQFESAEAPLFIQKVLGQVLFFPPNVAGWPEGRAWIDSSTLLARLRIPQALIASDYLNLQPKGDFAGNEDLPRTRIDRKVEARIDWQPLENAVARLQDPEAINLLSAYFLQPHPIRIDLQTLTDYVHGADRQTQLKSLVMRLTGTPEYQFC